MLSLSSLKRIVRDSLPARFQVPLKFHYNRIASMMESELQLLPALVRSGSIAIDIGGNRGTYAYALARLGVGVETFEPNPQCSGLLDAWASNKPAVNVHAVGLSDHNGESQLFVPVDENGVEHDASASIGRQDFEASRRLTIKVRTLDSFALENVGFIKIDVEGHESRVIDGAKETILRNRPAMLIEIEQRHLKEPITEVFSRIMALGYSGFYLDGSRLRKLSSFDLGRDQQSNKVDRYINNFIFLHDQLIQRGDYSLLLARQ